MLEAHGSPEKKEDDAMMMSSNYDCGQMLSTNETANSEETGMNVAIFDENLSTIHYLQNLTLSLDLIHRS